MSEGSFPEAKRRERILLGPRRWVCPTNSSRLLGRSLSARGGRGPKRLWCLVPGTFLLSRLRFTTTLGLKEPGKTKSAKAGYHGPRKEHKKQR